MDGLPCPFSPELRDSRNCKRKSVLGAGRSRSTLTVGDGRREKRRGQL